VTLSHDAKVVKSRSRPEFRGSVAGGISERGADGWDELRRELMDWALDRPDTSLDGVLEHATRKGLRYRDVILSLIGPVANELGQLWHDDRLSFLDVTLGTGRLQQALHRLRRPEPPTPAERRRILLTTVPGEQHTLGAVLAERLLWAEGMDTVLDIRGSRGVDERAAIGFDLVAISAPCHRNLTGLSAMITGLRRGAGRRCPPIMLGGGCADDAVAEAVAADGFARTVPDLLGSLPRVVRA
jgi:methanogenic corrinoid protein MtbC1